MQNLSLENKIIDLGLSYLEKEDKIHREGIENRIRFIEREIKELIDNKPLFFKKKWMQEIERLENIKMDLFRKLEQYI